jgi:hypothetical protein
VPVGALDAEAGGADEAGADEAGADEAGAELDELLELLLQPAARAVQVMASTATIGALFLVEI